MDIFVTATLIMGGISLYVGLYHFFMFLRRPVSKENIAFTLTCFSIALYDFFCANLYSSQSVAQGIFWQKGQFAVLNLFTVSIMWFCYYIFRGIPKKLLIVFVIIFCLFFTVGLLDNSKMTVSEETAMVKVIELSEDFVVTYNESDPGIIYQIQYVFMVVGYSLFLFFIIKNARHTENKYNKTMILALAIFYPAAVNDILVGAGVYPFIYILEYVYLFIIFSMAYILLNRFVNLYFHVETLRDNLEVKVVERTKELKSARDALWGEMRLAKKIQNVLVPPKPKLRDHEIAVFINPVDEVGGDYYDVFNIGGKEWVVIGDVSGHGVAAGLIMMMVETSIKSVLYREPTLSPTKLLNAVNDVLVDNLKMIGEDRYMTITALAYEESGVYHFAGMHQDILIYRAMSNTVDRYETKGIWLGVDGISMPNLQDTPLYLLPGDTMLLYTDGIIESKTADKVMLGIEGLTALLKNHGKKPVEEIKTSILDYLKVYEQKDDLTILIIKKVK